MSQDQQTSCGIVIQARAGSSRLPGKILKPFFEGDSILEILLERLQLNRAGLSVIVATTRGTADDVVCAISEAHGADVYRGSEDDVLKRFLEVTRTRHLDSVVRVCSDNPFLDLELLDEVIETAASSPGIDYVSHRVEAVPAIRTHFGVFCEWVSAKALNRVQTGSTDVSDKEHVTKYIYEHPDLFSIRWLKAPRAASAYPAVRLTVDTIEDFHVTAGLYSRVVDRGLQPSLQSAVALLQEHPEYISAMSEQIARQQK